MAVINGYFLSETGTQPSEYGMQQLADICPAGNELQMCAGKAYNSPKFFLQEVEKEPPDMLVIGFGNPNPPVIFSRFDGEKHVQHIKEIVSFVEQNKETKNSTWELCVQFLAKHSGKYKLGFLDD